MSWAINIAGSAASCRAKIEAEQHIPPAIKQGILRQLDFEVPAGRGIHLDANGHIERTMGGSVGESKDEYQYGHAHTCIRIIDFLPTG